MTMGPAPMIMTLLMSVLLGIAIPIRGATASVVRLHP